MNNFGFDYVVSEGISEGILDMLRRYNASHLHSDIFNCPLVSHFVGILILLIGFFFS